MALIDTSVVVDLDDPAVSVALPASISISTVTLGELASGTHLTDDTVKRARRQARLQQAEALVESLVFDQQAARSFGLIVAATRAAGRSHRSRIADLMIAATAHANQLDLYTRNGSDFAGLEELIRVVEI